MTRSRVLLLILVLCLWPARAEAQWWVFWGWLEEMSGPGPYRVQTVSIPLSCFCTDDQDARVVRKFFSFSDNDRNVKRKLMLRIDHFKSVEGRPRFQDVPEDLAIVNGLRIEPTFMFRLARPVDVGSGLGFVTLWGDAFDIGDSFNFTRFSVTPIVVTLTPFAFFDIEPSSTRREDRPPLWHRWLKVRFDWAFFLSGFDGRDFGNSRTSFSTGGELKRSISIEIDLSAFRK